jgi:hypothetical protein
MLLALILAISMVVALLRGGRLANLGAVDFRFIYLLFLPLLLQLIIFTPLAAYIPSGVGFVVAVYITSMLVGAIVVWLNRRLPGFPLLLAGLLSNLLVIVANDGHMPVWAAARDIAGMPPLSGPDYNVIPMTSASALWFLADVIPIPHGIPLANVFSIGDALIALGGVWFVQRILRPPRVAGAASLPPHGMDEPPSAEQASPVP